MQPRYPLLRCRATKESKGIRSDCCSSLHNQVPLLTLEVEAAALQPCWLHDVLAGPIRCHLQHSNMLHITYHI